MFTGIVEEVGEVISNIRGSSKSIIMIRASKVLEGTNIGDSIAINGVCLTVVNKTVNSFVADIMDETFSRSNLGELKKGCLVNLERALTLRDRLGGHIVSGHIDGTGNIVTKVSENNAVWIEIEASSSLLRYIVLKGSIAIDGVSLTVSKVLKKSFKVSVIPHTGKETTLCLKSIGEKVNLECDIVGKYIEKFLVSQKDDKNESRKIDGNFLMMNGFL